jgi:NADH/NAD ratio-sensing transcriptional regulator Rex
MLSYWHRLENSDNNSLLYSAFIKSKALSMNRGSCYSCILEFLNILEISQNASSLRLSKYKFIVNNQIRKDFISSGFNDKGKKNFWKTGFLC